MSLGW